MWDDTRNLANLKLATTIDNNKSQELSVYCICLFIEDGNMYLEKGKLLIKMKVLEFLVFVGRQKETSRTNVTIHFKYDVLC